MATPRRARVEATGERTVVTPLELFFDLVFVFAITQITDLMAEDPTVGHVFRGVLMLGVLWWSWTGYAWLGNIARADEGIIRVAMFAAMGGVFVAAITIPEAFDDGPGGLHGPTVFAVCYLVVRLVHLFMFWIISREDREFRGQVLRWIPSMVVATALLLIAGADDRHRRRRCSGSARCLGRLPRHLPGGQQLAAGVGEPLRRAARADRPHRAGRVDRRDRHRHRARCRSACRSSRPCCSGSRSPGALWWAYFDVTALLAEHALAAATGERQIRLARGGYTFLHLPMIIGVVLLSLGLKKAIGYVAGVDEHTLADPLYGVPMAALFGGAALYLLAHVVVQALHDGQPVRPADRRGRAAPGAGAGDGARARAGEPHRARRGRDGDGRDRDASLPRDAPRAPPRRAPRSGYPSGATIQAAM